MKLSVLFSDLYWKLAQGNEQIIVPPQDTYSVESGPGGIKRVCFAADGLDFVAEFKDRNLQVNLASGQPFATLRDGEVVAFESDFRRMLF